MAKKVEASPPTSFQPFACLACQTPLQTLGVEPFRVGGTTGGWKLLVGEWAELGESMLPMEVLFCPACRRVELRVPEQPK